MSSATTSMARGKGFKADFKICLLLCQMPGVMKSSLGLAGQCQLSVTR